LLEQEQKLLTDIWFGLSFFTFDSVPKNKIKLLMLEAFLSTNYAENI
jgi:hypothetical protein